MNKKQKVDFNEEIDFLDTSSVDVTEDEILEYLARIIAKIYWSKHTKKN